ncbi:paeninodin family lasso peptide [Radiobacillus sp. PE A8.2]
MNKQWSKPELEVLDVKMTMAGASGNQLDADFSAGANFDDLTFS